MPRNATPALRLVKHPPAPGAARAAAPPAVPPELVATLASAISALVDARVEQRLAAFKAAAGAGAEPDFYDGRTSPLGRRRHDQLARSGELGPDARKVGRRWLVPAPAVRAFIAAGKTPACAPRPAPAPALDDDLDALIEECGLQSPHRGKGAR